jgi:mycothiol synthase
MAERTVSGRRHPFLLISYTWLAELDAGLRADLLQFIDEAADYDAEAGFSHIGEFDLAMNSSSTDGRNRHLVVYASAEGHDEPRQLAAYLTLGAIDDAGVASAAFVVSPHLRSKGLATLLVETLAAEASHSDWFGTGARQLRVEASASHPAAERLADRFGFTVASEDWRLVLRLPDADGADLAPRMPHVEITSDDEPSSDACAAGTERSHRLSRVSTTNSARAFRRTEYRTGASPGLSLISHTARADRPSRSTFLEFCGPTVDAADGTIEMLITAAASDMRTRGVTLLTALIPAEAENVARVLRRHDFVHDQTDLTYLVDLLRL